MRASIRNGLRRVGGAATRTMVAAALLASSLVWIGAAASAAPKPREVDVRLLAQQGLAIALAADIYVSQFQTLFSIIYPQKGCLDLGNPPNGGSYKVASHAHPGGDQDRTNITMVFYFDNACKKPFARGVMRSVRRETDGSQRYAIKGDIFLSDRSGAEVAVLEIDEQAVIDAVTTVSGIGVFKPNNGGPTAHLGLACRLGTVAEPFSCDGGIAQEFPSLDLSLGSVTPLKIRPGASVGLSGKSSTLATAKAGKLRVTQVGKSSLGLSEPSRTVGSTETKGKLGQLTLFPPKPTNWTVTNSQTGDVFRLRLANETKRSFVASVEDKSGKHVAKIKVDQSGTGAVSYFGGDEIPVVNWILGG